MHYKRAPFTRQKVPFCIVKDGISEGKRRHIAKQTIRTDMPHHAAWLPET